MYFHYYQFYNKLLHFIKSIGIELCVIMRLSLGYFLSLGSGFIIVSYYVQASAAIPHKPGYSWYHCIINSTWAIPRKLGVLYH